MGENNSFSSFATLEDGFSALFETLIPHQKASFHGSGQERGIGDLIPGDMGKIIRIIAIVRDILVLLEGIAKIAGSGQGQAQEIPPSHSKQEMDDSPLTSKG